MAFTEIEIIEHMAVIEEAFWSRRRPSLRLRDCVREGQRFEGQSIELFFVRPAFKVQHVRSRSVWRLFWKRAELKWHRYPPCPEVQTLTDALQVIDEDANGCFFG